VPTNYPALTALISHIRRLWLHTLRRRSQKDRFSWERLTELANNVLATQNPSTVAERSLGRHHPRQEPLGQ
jgi:hypothetical protein